MSFRTIIIDDEQLARERLRRLLEPYSDVITIIDEATDGRSAVEKINDQNPDLIFLDIQMPEFTGFQVLEKIKGNPWVIFATAFDEFALKAFETNSIDYLLKPIDKQRLKVSIEKLTKLKPAEKDEISAHIKQLLTDLKSPVSKKLQVKVGDKIRFLDYKDIYFFQANEKYVEVNTFDEQYLVEQSLYKIEEDLSRHGFVRVHRSTLVNFNQIQEVFKWFNGKYVVRMKDKKKSELPVSLSFKENLGI